MKTLLVTLNNGTVLKIQCEAFAKANDEIQATDDAQKVVAVASDVAWAAFEDAIEEGKHPKKH
jgi:hypothetical protein